MTGKDQRVKAVTFDLWETLFFERDGDSNRRGAIRCDNLAAAFNELGVTVSVERVGSAMKQVAGRLLEIWETDQDASHVEQLELLVQKVSNGQLALKNEWVEKLSEAYVSPFFEVPPSLNPDAKEVLRRLSESGRRIGLICNTGFTPGFALRRFLDSEGVLDYFRFLAFSDEIGFRKPDKRIFHLVARRLKVEPYEAVHIGDNLRLDVWGAVNAGFRAIFYDCEDAKDKTAETDSTSLVAKSRNLGTLKTEHIVADLTITSFKMVLGAIEELEQN
ncbi:MAG TPA: HAD family hydrolase [Candidatus Eisenbacteria bacterium]|nr:HAD family hydrolase [Candidatus Eisenbacteria bacterium]